LGNLKKTYWRTRLKWEENIKNYFKEKGCESINWIELAQDGGPMMVINLRSILPMDLITKLYIFKDLKSLAVDVVFDLQK
jgi:hypothetical protein